MLFGDDTSLCHLYFRIHFPELILKPPMCGAFLSIEETGGCEQKGPDTKRGYFCSIIQGTRFLFLSTAVFMSPNKAGIKTRSVFCTSFSCLSVRTENMPSFSFTSFLAPTNCTWNNGLLPDTTRN